MPSIDFDKIKPRQLKSRALMQSKRQACKGTEVHTCLQCQSPLDLIGRSACGLRGMRGGVCFLAVQCCWWGLWWKQHSFSRVQYFPAVNHFLREQS